VTEDRFLFLSESKAYKTPNWLLPTCFQNHGNFVISLGNVTRWLGQQAEALGVEIFPASRQPKCCTTRTARSRAWPPATWASTRKANRPDFQLGMELHAKYTFFAEGARGHLGKQLIAKYKLDAGRDPQTYGIGIKELWEVKPEVHQPGLVVHTAGWPLDNDTYGGSFLYHLENNQVAVGYVVGLATRTRTCRPSRNSSATRPIRDPQVLRRRQAHLLRRPRDHRRRRAIAAQAGLPGRRAGLRCGLPQCLAHQGQPCRDQERHAGRRSRLRGAGENRQSDELAAYPAAFEASWLKEELHKARNFKPSMSKGLITGTLLVGIDQVLFGGKAPGPCAIRTPTTNACARPPTSRRSPIRSRTAS
jgi:electron-transferring-flavoprotein dehydrogenase